MLTEELLALAELAAKRAATEVHTWIPEKKDDNITGVVVEIGTITTTYGVYYTTTLELLRPYVENGETKTLKDDDLIRVAWMGAVLKATFERLVPSPGDMVSMHHQGMLTPKSGMNDYPNIVAGVYDLSTYKAKMPVNLRINVPTSDQIVNADTRTGEVATVDTTFVPFTEENEKLPDKRETGKKATAAEETG